MLLAFPQVAESTEQALAVRLARGQGRSYELHEIERIWFSADTLHVATTGGADHHPLEAILRLEFLWDDWTGIETPGNVAGVIEAVHLFQNEPNPFSPETRIAFELPQQGLAALRVYSAHGRLIRTLLEDALPAGPHAVQWDGRDEAGRPVATGVYFYMLDAPGVSESRKMLLLR
jgi:hypothetical protein